MSRLAAAAGHCRASVLGPDATVSREIILGGYLAGDRTVRDLLTRLERMDAPQRRGLIDRARSALGMESTEMADARRRITMTQRPQTEIRRRDNGTYYEVPIREARWAIGASGQPVDLNVAEAEAARQRASDESLRRQREAEAAQRQAEATAQREYERARREQARAELPDQIRRLVP
jgi:hypothetical protein